MFVQISEAELHTQTILTSSNDSKIIVDDHVMCFNIVGIFIASFLHTEVE